MPDPAAHSPGEALAQTGLFASLPTEDRAAIVTKMRKTSFRRGQLVFSRGDAPDGLYVLRSGAVRLSVLTGDGRELSFLYASVGSVFGEIATFDGGLRTAEATALTAVDALLWPVKVAQALIAEDVRVAGAVIRFLCARLRETDHQLEAIALCPIETRLARFLLSAAETREPNTAKGLVAISLGISQSELGLLIGASRPKVNAAIAYLENAGAFRRAGSDLVCNVTVLRALSERDE